MKIKNKIKNQKRISKIDVTAQCTLCPYSEDKLAQNLSKYKPFWIYPSINLTQSSSSKAGKWLTIAVLRYPAVISRYV